MAASGLAPSIFYSRGTFEEWPITSQTFISEDRLEGSPLTYGKGHANFGMTINKLTSLIGNDRGLHHPFSPGATMVDRWGFEISTKGHT